MASHKLSADVVVIGNGGQTARNVYIRPSAQPHENVTMKTNICIVAVIILLVRLRNTFNFSPVSSHSGVHVDQVGGSNSNSFSVLMSNNSCASMVAALCPDPQRRSVRLETL